MTADAKSLIARAERLRSDRTVFDSHWEEIRKVIYPKGDSFVSRLPVGSKAHQEVFDSTGEQNAELLAAAIFGMLTNPATKWFSLKAKDNFLNEIPAVAVWLERATNRMFAVLNSPEVNFGPQMHETYMDLVTYGTGGLFLGDQPGGLPIFQARALQELYLAENEAGRVDTVARWYRLAARQAVRQFRNGALNDKVREAAADPKKQENNFDFLHFVMPRDERAPGKLDALNLPWASVHINVTHRELIREGGFHEMPYMTPRWAKRANEVYGRGPGMKVLADVKMLQRAMKATIRGAEKAIDPALAVADDGVLSPVRMTSSGVNIIRAELLNSRRPAIEPIHTGARPDLGEQFMEPVRKRIGDGFHTNLLQFTKDPTMTATQAIKIAEEVLRILGPMLGRAQPELLGPVVERMFGIMLRAGMFEAVPNELADRELEVEFVSPLARAQRLSEVNGVLQTLEIGGALTVADEAVWDNVEANVTFRRVAEVTGYPKDGLRAPEAVARMRAERQRVAQEQAAKQDVLMAAEAAKKAAPAVRQLAGRPGAAANG